VVAVLAVALVYATVLWRRRRGRLEQVSERATAQLYEREAERERRAEVERARP
jgi:Flp pilus assembly protein TadB